MTPSERVAAIRGKIPSGGLFAEKEWRVAPEAFPLSPKHLDKLEKLGHVLHLFAKACNLLYRQSVRGKQPAWIADLLDRGKPPELVALSRAEGIAQELPAVIRPDLIVTEEGFGLFEVDTIPGGLGLTAWLGESYAALGDDVLGGPDGMRKGFASIFPEGDVVISEEAATYRPEFEFLVGPERVKAAEGYRLSPERPVYRFFESFDWPNLPTIRESYDPDAQAGKLTPPIKPYLEEKLWLALFWLRPLLPFWRRELGDKGVKMLKEIVPYTWLVDPTPLPVHGVLPGLDIQNWGEMASFSQKERDLVLKISGFSPQAWGSRGVHVGSDLAAGEWQKRLDEALAGFGEHPYILQRFAKGTLLEHTYEDEKGEIVPMKGRARVCPYYFVTAGGGDYPTLGGALVTFCPADKKLVHGMRDAILVPVRKSG
ncbi:hypothetical protein SAMN05444156_2026 [Verrucomicrobium sp. GAS474]|uniref:hypothetical protein n=1 Tax=Verrucomicrobium sp. GAS474 TaxID=1882831 RepID=UPI00087BD12D|nr:hypothetical protein [Verrucomicrobium sp. GAS474]SDU11252.1 hypothetical protein SAMN05444156_2026 [Verrucomicrobium sp. GAS474]